LTNDEVHQVTIEVTTTGGSRVWAQPYQYNITLFPGESDTRTISLNARSRTTAGTNEVRIECRITHIWGSPSPDPSPRTTGFYLVVNQFAEMDLFIEPSSYSINEGKRSTLKFCLNNTGNDYDGFNLNLQGLPGGWNVEYLSNKGVVSPGENITVLVNLTAHEATTARLRLVVRSHYNDSVVVDAQVIVETEAEDSWLGSWGAVVIGCGAGAMAVVAGIVYWRRLGNRATG